MSRDQYTDKDMLTITYSNLLLSLSLDHCVAVTQAASAALAMGSAANPKKLLRTYERIESSYQAKYQQLLKEAAEALEDER